jgi:hypothetical protein
MIDNDADLDTIYAQFNHDEQELIALNCDLYGGLKQLATHIENEELRPRNLVVSFRLAPEAFSDIKLFIQYLGKVICEEADFIVTIGAGDSLADFNKRLKVMNELYEELSARGMAPLRIINYKGKSLKYQHSRPVYGQSQYASYEIIYCHIYKNKLN